MLCGNSLNSVWTGFLEWICRKLDRTGHQLREADSYRRSRIFYHRYSVSAKPRKRKAGSFSDPAGTQQTGRRSFFQRSVSSTATETGALFWKYFPVKMFIWIFIAAVVGSKLTTLKPEQLSSAA